jgi:multiple antibiotic resistance protein
MEGIQLFVVAALSIFAIVNPIGNLPVFAALTQDMETSDRRRVLRLAGVVALAVVAVMGVVGKFLLHSVFHITMSEFMFAGGLLITVVSIHNVLGGLGRKPARAKEDADEAIDRAGQVSLAVSPIAMPFLVGPGTIMTVMLTVQEHDVWFGLGATLAAFVFVLLVLNYAYWLLGLIGPVGSLAVGRVMQIFIVAVGVRFLFRGLAEAFPALVR